MLNIHFSLVNSAKLNYFRATLTIFVWMGSNYMKSDFLSMYLQLATAHVITIGQRNAIFRLLKADMVRNICFHI